MCVDAGEPFPAPFTQDGHAHRFAHNRRTDWIKTWILCGCWFCKSIGPFVTETLFPTTYTCSFFLAIVNFCLSSRLNASVRLHLFPFIVILSRSASKRREIERALCVHVVNQPLSAFSCCLSHMSVAFVPHPRSVNMLRLDAQQAQVCTVARSTSVGSNRVSSLFHRRLGFLMRGERSIRVRGWHSCACRLSPAEERLMASCGRFAETLCCDGIQGCSHRYESSTIFNPCGSILWVTGQIDKMSTGGFPSFAVCLLLLFLCFYTS